MLAKYPALPILSLSFASLLTILRRRDSDPPGTSDLV
jgi:hypothetical protein